MYNILLQSFSQGATCGVRPQRWRPSRNGNDAGAVEARIHGAEMEVHRSTEAPKHWIQWDGLYGCSAVAP